MGRPRKYGNEKALHVMVSVSPEDKLFTDQKGLSPSDIYHEAVERIKKGIGENSELAEVERHIAQVRAVYVKSERGECNPDAYIKAIDIFLKVHTDWIKVDIMDRVERRRSIFIDHKANKEVDSNETIF